MAAAAGSVSQDIESYLGASIAHLVGLPCDEVQIRDKLQQAEVSQCELQHQVEFLQDKLVEMHHKYMKAKEESSLSAHALRKQIAETQKIAEQCRHLTNECSRLENECMLYLNDRQIFMEAADEAEERAAQAEHQMAEQMRLVFEEEMMRQRDEMLVHDAVTSAVNAGAWKAVEQERDMAVYRLKSSERCIHDLYTEVQELKKDAQQYEANLKKAEVEVEFLYQENNELKLLLGGKYNGQAISPLHIQGIKCSNPSKPHSSLLGLPSSSSRQPLTPLRCNLTDWRKQYR